MADLFGMLQAAAGVGGGINPRDHFNTVLYTGTGSSQSITGVGFQPDWVWIKERSGAADHAVYDAIRGTTKQLETNQAAIETTEANGLTAFGSDGFTVGSLAQLNTNTDTYVAWNWNAGGSNATNTDGNITSTVRVNTTAGIAIVNYTGNGTSNQTVGHGLGVVPAMIMVVDRNLSQFNGWFVYHKSFAANLNIQLHSSGATYNFVSGSGNGGVGTSPTTTTFLLQNGTSNNNNVNDNNDSFMAYCFAEVEGFSKFSSYTGNGSATGPSVTTDFEPTWLLIKRTDTTGDWILLDSARDATNPRTAFLEPNTADAEATGNDVDFNSTGFQLKSTSASINASGGTYIYACFA